MLRKTEIGKKKALPATPRELQVFSIIVPSRGIEVTTVGNACITASTDNVLSSSMRNLIPNLAFNSPVMTKPRVGVHKDFGTHRASYIPSPSPSDPLPSITPRNLLSSNDDACVSLLNVWMCECKLTPSPPYFLASLFSHSHSHVPPRLEFQAAAAAAA